MLKEFSISIVRTLREQGHKAYLVGGCVRDLLLHREPADYDVSTDATPDQVMRIFPDTYAVGVLRCRARANFRRINEPGNQQKTTLIDQKPDSQNHLSHLSITKAEKADLQSDLDITLKGQSDQGDHDSYVSAAMVLR